MKPTLLVLIELLDSTLAVLQKEYNLIYEHDPAKREQVVKEKGAEIQAVLTNGIIGLRAVEMRTMPKLELVCTIGAGYDRLDVNYAHTHGIVTASGSGTNADCVADQAMALLLAVVRNVVHQDHLCREGVWRTQIALPANVSGKKMGIIGLGTIGQKIAQRALGFDIEIGYHNRKPKAETTYLYFENAVKLAQWADYLVISAPGGAQTRHMINASVLEALGSKGYVVNVGRGEIVDTQALAYALQHQVIAGAGLDVYESEPSPPQELIGFDTLVITPHMGGWSPESIKRSEEHFIENARRYFSGKPVTCQII